MDSPNPQFPYQHVALIINPISGQKNEADRIIREYLAPRTDLKITYYSTTPEKNATQYTMEGLNAGADLVVAYGGDGTMAQVAAALRGTDVPLGMLPGGTANVMAIDLNIPVDLEQALDVIFQQPHQTRVVDMGEIDNQLFLLRVGIGYEAQATAAAPREAKRERGRLAYFQNAMRQIRRLRPSRYVINADGRMIVTRGITCLICNSTNIGVKNMQLVNKSELGDGLLDVIVIEGFGVRSLLKIMGSMAQRFMPRSAARGSALQHWQAKTVTVEIRPRQYVAYDGELMKQAERVSVRIVPAAVNVIVPAGQ